MTYSRCFILFTDNSEVIYDNIKKIETYEDSYKLINEDDMITMVLSKNVKTIGFLPYFLKGAK